MKHDVGQRVEPERATAGPEGRQRSIENYD